MTGKAAKHLMLQGADLAHGKAGMAFDNGLEVHLETAVAGGKAPRARVISARRQVEGDLIQLVDSAIQEDDIF